MRIPKTLGAIALLTIAGCSGGSSDGEFHPGRRPDVLPVMLNKELPFRYPPALYAQKVQGNVTLRIFVDTAGQIVPDSTHVAETSGFAALDSAAVKGSRELKFAPGRTKDSPVAVSILFPVYFRHPDAAPLPGDSAISKAPTRTP